MHTTLSSFHSLDDFHDETMSTVRARLGDRAFDGAWRRGSELSTAEAITLALERAAPSTPRAAADESGLTRREREVAGLIAEGLSNREIAAKLVVAQRTAEGHVENILSKLGSRPARRWPDGWPHNRLPIPDSTCQPPGAESISTAIERGTDMPGFASLAMITLDAEDPAALATFYSQVLGWEVLHSEAEYAMIGDGSTNLGFGKLPGYSGPGWPDEASPKRYHLDFYVDDLDKAEEQALALGATKPAEQPTPDRWRVLLDPGGHPFDLCLKST